MNKNNSIKIVVHVFRGAVCFILLCLVAWLMPRMLAEPKVIGKELGAEAAAERASYHRAQLHTGPDVRAGSAKCRGSICGRLFPTQWTFLRHGRAQLRFGGQ